MALSGWCSQRGRPNHKGCRGGCTCECHTAEPVNDPLFLSAAPRTLGGKETTSASRPRTKGVAAPIRGLADRLETTDS